MIINKILNEVYYDFRICDPINWIIEIDIKNKYTIPNIRVLIINIFNFVKIF